jgi:ATP-dependent Clp protease ATP-binding subunit ClpX
METILLDTMYQLPSLKNVSKVVVDESVVLGHSPPYVVYKSETDKAPEEPRRASGFGR